MNSLVAVLPAHRFDEKRLRDYLATHIPGLTEIAVQQFQGGQSNPTFLLDCGTGKLVLRKKPPGPLLPSAHQVEREFRIIKALHGSVVPVPRPILLCEDAGIIGTAFYVMEYVSGQTFERADLEGSSPAERRSAYDALNRTIADLHQLDWASLGLEDYGRPQNYLTRQVDRWSRQYKASIVGEADPLVDEIIVWLRENLPADDKVTIVHGDFRLGNLLFGPGARQVTAVLDWELSTLGDPLSDLAYCCMPYHMPSGQAGVRGLQGLDLEGLGIPTEEEFLAAYCRRTGRQGVAAWPFYMAFSLFRSTAIVQGVFARAVQGNASSTNAIDTGARVQILARAAHAIAYGKGSRL